MTTFSAALSDLRFGHCSAPQVREERKEKLILFTASQYSYCSAAAIFEVVVSI
jgi:hypothetical protein